MGRKNLIQIQLVKQYLPVRFKFHIFVASFISCVQAERASSRVPSRKESTTR